MNEQEYDRMLSIRPTSGLQVLSSSIHQNRYEATPYAALEALAAEHPFYQQDGLVDYGSGKGRVPFFFHHQFQLTATGVEVNGSLYQEALENQANYMKKKKNQAGSVRFERCLAEEYKVEKDQNKFYFFNPFSTQIFIKVVNNITKSAEKHPRIVDLILYYPTTEYIHFLHDKTAFYLEKDIKVPGYFEKDEHERFLIFRLNLSNT
ncbi:SAM-dependent methyltransferase [Jeotgalibacillus sp. ET6]|uniref:SAM-dependent methyltransferase n=1 Tax=Jeotgalibacillus sp. ET6 TaxID=3037260 RepID=UPI0024189783|nr:SAM-dependent methyltransferase [Jeotgalibacillus sp. ET6]MDG5472562.1 SAM-dependent methyltransferase [Jeotgalibacillus sp. ET6]